MKIKIIANNEEKGKSRFKPQNGLVVGFLVDFKGLIIIN